MCEHVEDYLGFLTNIRKKGRYKIINIPLDISVRSVFCKSMIAHRYNAGHLHYFTKETAMATLKDTGHEIIDYFYADYMIGLRHKSLLLRLLKPLFNMMHKLDKDMTVRILGGSSLMVLTK